MENVSETIVEKGKKLVEEERIVKDTENEKRIHFRVLGDSEEHIVIFIKLNGTYECDCSWSTLKHKECSHIIAAKIISRDSNNPPPS